MRHGRTETNIRASPGKLNTTTEWWHRVSVCNRSNKKVKGKEKILQIYHSKELSEDTKQRCHELGLNRKNLMNNKHSSLRLEVKFGLFFYCFWFFFVKPKQIPLEKRGKKIVACPAGIWIKFKVVSWLVSAHKLFLSFIYFYVVWQNKAGKNRKLNISRVSLNWNHTENQEIRAFISPPFTFTRCDENKKSNPVLTVRDCTHHS